MARRIPYIGDEPGLGGGIVPPNFVGNATRDEVNTAASPGVSQVSGSWGAAAGGTNPLMTSANAPAPYSVVGEQPAQIALPSVAVVEWDQAAYGAFATTERAYLTVYPYAYHNPTNPLHRREVLADGTTLREPRRIIHAGPPRRVYAYSIKAAFGGREPMAWTLKGGNSAAGPWVTLDARNHAAGNMATNPLMNSAEPTFSLPDMSLVPLAGFTHYLLEFTKAYPLSSGSGGYIDLSRIVFLHVGYTIQSQPRLFPDGVGRAALSVRLRGRPGLQPSEVSAYLTREGGLANWREAHLAISRILGDGSVVMVGDADLSGLAAGDLVALRLAIPHNDVRVAGWAFGPSA